MTRVFIDGFENHENLSTDFYLWDTASGGAIVKNNGTGHTGNFSCQLSLTAVLEKVITATSIVGVGLKARILWGWTSAVIQVTIKDASDNVQGILWVQNTGITWVTAKIKKDDGTEVASTIYSKGSNNWVHIQILFTNTNDTDKVMVVKLNGDAVFNESYSNSDADTATSAKIRFTTGNTNQATWVDDIAIDDTELTGVTEIYLVLPDADGTTNDWTASSGEVNFSMVDEVPSDTSDYVETNTIGHLDLYGLESLPIDKVDIKAILGDTHINLTAGDTAVNAIGISGEGTHYGESKVGVGGWEHITHLWPQNPATSGEWSEVVVNNLEAGFKYTG